MQKDKKQIILNTLAVLVKQRIPKGKAMSKLAAEYGLSTSILCKLTKGKKNPQIITFINIAEIIGVDPCELFIALMNGLPKDYTTLDI